MLIPPFSSEVGDLWTHQEYHHWDKLLWHLEARWSCQNPWFWCQSNTLTMMSHSSFGSLLTDDGLSLTLHCPHYLLTAQILMVIKAKHYSVNKTGSSILTFVCMRRDACKYFKSQQGQKRKIQFKSNWNTAEKTLYLNWNEKCFETNVLLN